MNIIWWSYVPEGEGCEVACCMQLRDVVARCMGGGSARAKPEGPAGEVSCAGG